MTGSLREHVERGARDLAGVERGLERVVVDQLAARAVDDPHAVAALGERLGVSQPWVSGVFGRWIEMKSACAYSSSAVSACSTPSSRKRLPDTYGS